MALIWKHKSICVAYIDILTAAALSISFEWHIFIFCCYSKEYLLQKNGGGKWHTKLIYLCLNCLYVISATALILRPEILRRIEISMNGDCR